MIILQDNKEKTPWTLNFYTECEAQESIHLETGDYTIKGLEDKVRIERKHSTGELAMNLGRKSKQFQEELRRLKLYPHRYLICEFPLDYIMMFPKKSGIPKTQWKYIRMHGKFMYARLMDWIETYDITPYFCENRAAAERKALEVLLGVYKEYE
jgi:hypothetical protein